ncbi:MAG: alpha/beta hydrolase-fold protein [Bryobacteraceae bacterium]
MPAAQDFIQLHIFGRTDNAYRWSGETDVFEALASVESRYRIDPRRIVLRGFSMGGAGAWHLGLHHPGRWAAVEAGAGFTETIRYARLQPPYPEAALRIYDAVDYARNAVNLPIVGYGGDEDPQLQASVNIREQLAREDVGPDLRALFLVGPKIGHKWHPDSQRESDRFLDASLPQRVPDRVRFVTYTTRYNTCFWITVEALQQHYQRAEVDASRGGEIRTRNVARLRLDARQDYLIDQQKVHGDVFEKTGGRWKPAGPLRGLRKIHGLQGPIDDAFRDSFLCVKPARGPYPVLDLFAAEYAKWLRADPRIQVDASAADIAAHHLVLFGDPWSNPLIARVLPKLPLTWTREVIALAGRRFPASDHYVALIYPNPLNPARYVVLNSGHTFGEKEFRGTNALLYPRLGDWAVIRIRDGLPAATGYFDDFWR